MKNKLLVTTALVGLAFASSAMAADELKEYEAGSVISADDTGHTKGDTRISFMGDAKLEKDVTFGNYVTLHNKTNLTGDKKLTVTGYLTQTEAGSDVSGVDLEIQKGKVNNSQDSEVTEGELVLGNNLTVGNVNMADGTGIYLYKTEEDYVEIMKVTLDYGAPMPKGTQNESRLHVDERGVLTIQARTKTSEGVKPVENTVQLTNLSSSG